MRTTQTIDVGASVGILAAQVSRQSATELYERMKRDDFSQVLFTAVKECGVTDDARARELLDGFLQWLAVIPDMSEGKNLQMFKDLDRIWHAMILHTKFYREFCQRHFGTFIDHDPAENVLERQAKRVDADYTLELLRAAFGSDLNPELFALENIIDCCRRPPVCITGEKKM